MFDVKGNDNSKDTIDAVRHSSTYDTNAINRAIERASRDTGFINRSIQMLKGMQFPAYKDEEVSSLFESLDGYVEYKDPYHVQKILEENNLEKKTTHQISETTRHHPEVLTRSKTIDQSIKDSEAINENEERKDYPEVPPSAMSNFVCDKCGKVFQNQNDLLQHKRFEG
jgi:lipopolysaccharide biosynthesis regulator YciM